MTMHGIKYAGLRNAIQRGVLHLCHFASANVANRFVSEFGLMVFFPTTRGSRQPALVSTVHHVGGSASNPKMGWVNTRGVVALVANIKAIWDRADVRHVGKPMGWNVSGSIKENPITGWSFGREPVPAIIVARTGKFAFKPIIDRAPFAVFGIWFSHKPAYRIIKRGSQ